MATITFHLAQFPTLSQLHEPANPYPDVNADMDCVPTSIAAALTWFTGTKYYGDEVIDQVYGSGYTGGTAASAYTSYCAARGVTLYPVNGTPPELVTALHTYVRENRPCLVTVPGQWNNPATSGAHPGDVTHVMVVCGEGAGVIQVMNPWTGAFEVYTDSWFQLKLCYGQIWPMEGNVIPTGWHDDGKTLTAPNAVAVVGSFRDWVLAHPWNPADWPMAAERTVTQVTTTTTAYGAGKRQDFKFSALGYSVARNETFLVELGAELAHAQQQLATASSDNATLQSQLAQATAQIKALQATQGSGSIPGAAESVAAMKAIQTAFAAINAPKPSVTAPLPVAQPN